MENLVKTNESLLPSIKIERTDKNFDGDCKITYKIFEDRMDDFAPSAAEIGHVALLIGRNDMNNPKYRWGKRYMLHYLTMLFRDNTMYWEPNIRQNLLQELEQSEKIKKLLQLRQEVLS